LETGKILELYDKYERKNAFIPGYTRIDLDNVVRMIDPLGKHSYIAYSKLSDENADATIKHEIEYFSTLNQEFEWKYYTHDEPNNQKQLLHDQGFEIDEDEAIMVLDLTSATKLEKQSNGKIDIRKITDPKLLGDVVKVESAVWDEDFGQCIANMEYQLTNNPDYISVYIGYVDNIPASSAWVNFPPKSPFASLWGGSTLKEYRKQGVYTELLATRMEEAKRRGYTYLTIDAGKIADP